MSDDESTSCFKPSTKTQDNIKTMWSGALVLFGMIVMTEATLGKNNLFWPSVPPYIQIPFLVLDILLLGTLEGIQISLVALKNHNSEAFKDSHPRAYKTNALCQKNGNLEKFLMGRQVFVIITVFFGSYVTTQSADFTSLLGWQFPSWVGAAFFQTGLMGVLVIAVFAQLMVQVVASSYPINFMEAIPFVYPVLCGCLIFENLGIVYLCYTVADIFMHATGLKKPDDHSPPHMSRRGFSHLFSHDFRSKIRNMTRIGSKSTEVTRRSVLDTKQELGKNLCDVLATFESNTAQDTQVIQEAMRKYPQLFNNFPSVVGSKVYASPVQVQQYMKDNGHRGEIPDFLKPTNDETHIPPHVFATRLLMEQHALVQAAKNAGMDVASQDAKLLDAIVQITAE